MWGRKEENGLGFFPSIHLVSLCRKHLLFILDQDQFPFFLSQSCGGCVCFWESPYPHCLSTEISYLDPPSWIRGAPRAQGHPISTFWALWLGWVQDGMDSRRGKNIIQCKEVALCHYRCCCLRKSFSPTNEELEGSELAASPAGKRRDGAALRKKTEHFNVIRALGGAGP